MASLTTTLRNTRLTAIKTANDTGGANTGKCKVYSGNVPTNVGTAISGQTLLSTITAVTYAAASGGQINISSTADTNAAASGTPSFVRFTDSSDAAYLQCTAGVNTGEVSFNQAVAYGGQVSLSGTITEGNA